MILREKESIMAKIRQLPGIYLRGSVANITMSNITAAEQAKIGKIVDYVANHQSMISHREKMLRKLGQTISGDYTDKTAATQEYLIAIWRGVVSLFYHKNYTFICTACNSKTYTKRNKVKPIDRILTVCPNCQCTIVENPANTELKAKQIINIAEYKKVLENVKSTDQSPTIVSPIAAVPGAQKYDHPEAIIEDEKQLQKFFGEYVWNYFRQQINENKRKLQKFQRKITATADIAILQDILNLCLKMYIEHQFCIKTEPKDGYYHIGISILQTSPEFTVELNNIITKAQEYNIEVRLDHTQILIKSDPFATTIETVVTKPEYITVFDPSNSDEEGDQIAINNLSYKSVGGLHMDQEDHIIAHDNKEAYQLVRQELPDGQCREVFDILSQHGEAYRRFKDFAASRNNNNISLNLIAQYLNTTTRVINQHKQTIKHICLIHSFVPC